MFFIITGKGGVGKSTCSVLLANYLSYKGSTVLYHYSVSPVYRFVDRRVKMYYLDVEEESKEYLKIKLPFFLWYPLSRSSIFRVFSRLIPGFSELIILGKMWYDFYNKKYDFYVFDAFPTGQILSMLKIPEAGLKSDVGGVVRSDFEKMYDFVKNLRLILVSVPEQIVYEESEEFITSAREYGLNLDTVFLNKFYRRNLLEQDLDWIEMILIEGKLNEKERQEFKDMLSFEKFFSESSEKFYQKFIDLGFNVVKVPFSFSGMTQEFFSNLDGFFKDFA
ncbi:MAG: hypothetical protein NZ927_04870 [Candidatus Calescibacterium sp.]|nr:hypothetical protein [Candidatus Calescibacterium sp.]MCX7733400.1 hypothetical protein [bacterium]MDW8087458.1 ArsA-related P-loop ATPase [Candidatus Calescibacterium sp.]